MKEYLKEMYRRKDLLVYLVISGLKAEYRNTFLGYLWWILDPLLFSAVFYFLRVVILGMEGENIGAFLVIGLVAWKWIASATNTSAKSIFGKSGVITQVYLPKAIFPIGTTLTHLFNFTFGLVVVAMVVAFYRIVPGFEVLWLPLIMVAQFIFLSAVSLVLGYYCLFIRDIDNILSHLMRFWFYASPVIWETGRLPAQYSLIVDLNPASAFLTSYRNILMYQTGPELFKLLVITMTSLLVIAYMLNFYRLNEHKIIKAL